MEKQIYGVSINTNKYYSLSELQKLFGAKDFENDCNYIILRNNDWDNDLVLFIQSIIDNKYKVLEA